MGDVIPLPRDEDGSIRGRVVAMLRAGTLGPGDRLMEADLAARFRTSRTPVREALRQLEAEGLVSHVPRVGATVRRLDYSEVVELYEMRAVMEGTAARLAARMASAVELAALAEVNLALAEATEPARAASLNRVFHARLLDAARNRFLSQAALGLERTMSILGPSTLGDAARAAAAVEEHAAVLDALSARDGGQAEALMRRHIEGAQAQRMRQMTAGAGA
jgi:DNA-binding GntR family transcriptional regulator